MDEDDADLVRRKEVETAAAEAEAEAMIVCKRFVLLLMKGKERNEGTLQRGNTVEINSFDDI